MCDHPDQFVIGLGHVMDWSSLTPLLPSECWSVLAELPQLKRHSHSRFENTKPQFTLATPKESQSPVPSEGKFLIFIFIIPVLFSYIVLHIKLTVVFIYCTFFLTCAICNEIK